MFLMEYKGFFARIMRAKKLANTRSHFLPPGSPIEVYPVDAFKTPLDTWIPGWGNFVVPIKPDWGLWFDWTRNNLYNTSILPTVKGMNPITGQKTEGYGLERYVEKCPLHNIAFKHGRFCEKCNYVWPPQNYVSNPNTLWWDGFRTSEGKVRQFFFTEDLARSIPENILGSENTIPAFGFAFYAPKKPRVDITRGSRGTYSNTLELKTSTTISNYCGSTASMFTPTGGHSTSTATPSSHVPISETSFSSGIYLCCDTGSLADCSDVELVTSGEIDTVLERSLDSFKEVGVGAGAEILQDLQPDSMPLDYWQNEPSAVMRLYFIFMDEFKKLKKEGFNDLSGTSEGFLHGMPVG